MRCFIAVDISEEIREKISKVVEDGRMNSRGIRWVPIENIHLTLKFLGNVDEKLIPDIEKGLSSVCVNHASFTINIRGTGAFPSFKYPNVLWVGIDKSDELKKLYFDIEEAMFSLGFEREGRNFSPHLTIGRVKDRKGIEPVMAELYTFKDTFFGSIEIKEVLFMRSVLKPTGAEYSKMAGFKLFPKQI
ncbi:MAG: RNA 2',3'-cyclic phosphodiesterase [Thermodesulfovibrionales bacterium]|nr:RNA 2',3'-cyclic phosphodiesterase [Thermodesulfovibrionales bacterium]